MIGDNLSQVGRLLRGHCGTWPALLPLDRGQGETASPTGTSTRSSLSPRALDDDTIYPNGISTSLPEDVQEAFIRKIQPGLARVRDQALRLRDRIRLCGPAGARPRTLP